MKTVLWFTDCYVILLLCHFMMWVFFVFEFSFVEHSQITRQREKGVDNSVSSLPLPPVPRILRHYPGDYCREFTSFTYLVSEVEPREPQTTKLCDLGIAAQKTVFYYKTLVDL